eukprot:TRINITY_DN97506_c0_g1_i1.p1 TRINITY_DN97506_c0_g1~~TRINITY_DN97506_c0_g1_i1.p1  ORF type:complete len:342 (+),score=61.52 TRINITY_DN97506_c0_g1_i1:34-1059(+)
MPLRASVDISHALSPDAGLALLIPQARCTKALNDFLASQPANTAPLVSFAATTIQFTPRAPDLKDQEFGCDEDMAVCNRECERLFGDRRAEMEEPCKLAVAKKFSGGGCFPATAAVQERRRGRMLIRDVQIGDELAVGDGSFSPVIACLHEDPAVVSLYLLLQHGNGQLAISPEHLVRCRRLRGDASAASGSWCWRQAQEIRAGDELEDAEGKLLTVQCVLRVCKQGAFAPLTECGELLVEGIRCSCYAPPSELRARHELCHVAMLPLRAFNSARLVVEYLSRPSDAEDPLVTLKALWLLPTWGDPTVHPYANGLLTLVGAAKVLSRQWSRQCGEVVNAKR